MLVLIHMCVHRSQQCVVSRQYLLQIAILGTGEYTTQNLIGRRNQGTGSKGIGEGRKKGGGELCEGEEGGVR